MKQNKIFIGIDVSKSTLDICMIEDQEITNQQIPNTLKAINSFINRVLKHHQQIFMGVENTGYYNWNLNRALDQKGINFFVIAPLHLKKSLGLTRGKNDQIDAQRIAEYVELRHTQLVPSILPRKIIRTLQVLIAQRNRLIKTKTQLNTAFGEVRELCDKEIALVIKQSNQTVIDKINNSIKKIEEKINELIKTDETLNEKYAYATSVQGVGKVLAWTLLVKTNEFISINNPRKLACYAGVVPFEHQSGTSVKKRNKVSFLADKYLKKLVHMAAMRAIQLKGELKDYYTRKVLEGKNKMSVLNAVRNKIIARVCAVINNKRPYENLFLS